MSRNCRLLSLLLFLLLIPGNFACALTFHAALSPIHAVALPGEVVNRDFTLSLPATEARTQFKLHVQDFYRSEDLKQSFYKDPGTLPQSCAPWVQINPVETAVDPGTTLDAKISIVVPGDAKPGGYWCVLCVDQVPDPLAPPLPDGSIGMRCLASITLGIYVDIEPVNIQGRITAVSIDGQSASVTVADTGDCPVFASGRFEFVRPGQTAPFVSVPIAKTTIYPQPINSARLSVTLPGSDKLPSGSYLVRVVVDIGLDHYIGVQKEIELSRDDLAVKQAQAGSP